MTAQALSASGLTVTFDGCPVLERVNVDIDSGEVVAVIGPNGSGKTTLLSCLAGLQRIEAGRILVAGNDLSSLPARKRAQEISLVPQDHLATFPYTVRDTVLFGRAPHLRWYASPSTQDRAISEWALDVIGIGALAERPVSQLSGGERRLALIARGLAQMPSILLLDEPTAHLDVTNESLVLRMLRNIAHDRGIAVMLTTHAPGHALAIADRVVMLRRGCVEAVGEPEQVITEQTLNRVYGGGLRVITLAEPVGQTRLVVVPDIDLSNARDRS